MAQAIFGLVGVVIGALASVAVESWRARQQRKIRRKAAARLVMEEILAASTALKNAGEQASSREEAATKLREALQHALVEEAEWRENRGTLAEVLNDVDWAVVTDAYYSIRLVRQAAAISDNELIGQAGEALENEGFVSAGQALAKHAVPSLLEPLPDDYDPATAAAEPRDS